MVRHRRLPCVAGLALLAAIGLASCAGVDTPTSPAQQPAGLATAQPSANPRLLAPLLNGLVGCNQQQYGIASRVIGPLGGSIQVNGHVLVIPPGALAQNVLITAEAPNDNYASVRFQPEGLRFAKQARLTLDYSFCPIGRLNLLKRVAYTSDSLDILSYLLSTDDLLRMQVSARLDHFSRYAVAW